MVEEWLIDGYNLLHSNPGKHWFERLASFASREQHAVILVLDGRGDALEFEKFRTSHFRVIYSKEVSADATIERYCFQHRQNRHFTVVTNDRAVSNIARGLGAHVLKNDVFVEFLQESEHNTKKLVHDQNIESHGFNRPFDRKLKEKGFLG